MTSFYADSFHYFSNKPGSVCAFLATTRPIFNSSIIPVTLNLKQLWRNLREKLHFGGRMDNEQSFLEVFVLSDTLQFAPSVRIARSVENTFLIKMFTTLIKERRYFCKTLKNFETRDTECAVLVCENVQSLQSVVFANELITNRSVAAIGKLTLLTHLKFLAGNFSTFQPLSALTSLSKLNLTACSGLQGHDLVHLENMKLLRALNLNDVNCLSDADFLQLPVFPILESLNISYTNIGDQGIVAVAKQKTLQTLELRLCPSVTLAGFQLLFDSLHELSDLDLESNRQIDDDCLFALSKGSYSLRRLNLSWSSEITDSGVVDLVSEMIDLEALDLERCEKLTDKSIKAISELKHLVELKMMFIDGFSKEGFGDLVTLPRLGKLTLSESKGTFTLNEMVSEISKFKSLRFLVMDIEPSPELLVQQVLKLAESPMLENVQIWTMNPMCKDIRKEISSLVELHLPFELSFHTDFAEPFVIPRSKC